MTQSPTPSSLDPSSRQARSNILRNLLLHKRLNRREIGQIVSLSGGAVTKHTQWLIDREMIRARKKRVATSLRPVEELSLNAQRGVGLSLRLDLGSVAAELVAYDGTAIRRWDEPVRHPTQAGLLEALNRAAEHAHAASPKIDAVGLSVVGYLSPEVGMIFGVEGVEGGWEPCQPGIILPALQKTPRLYVWTDVACKVRGLAGRLRCDDRVLYVEYVDSSFRVADMERGRVHLGRQGSTGASMHQSITPDGPLCYCGRRGCFAAYLRQPTVSDELLTRGLREMLHQLMQVMQVDHVGLEWDGQTSGLEKLLREQGVGEIHAITDGQRLRSEGLRALTIEIALGSKLEEVSTEPAGVRISRGVSRRGVVQEEAGFSSK